MTSLGINNVGELVMSYGVEDIDKDENDVYYFRAGKSTFFMRIRELFKSELEAMFRTCESKGAWSASSLINLFDKEQAMFPEEIWRLDIERKYIRTYRNGATEFLESMLNGRKKYQRRQFERNQEMYMATKYFGTTATSNMIRMRFNNPENAVIKQDFTLYLTPYSDMYLGVEFGNTAPVQTRAKAGVEYTIHYPLGDTADITTIYGASFIKGIGDLSKCYVGDNNFSQASRLQKLVMGSNVEGYSNNFLKQLTFGNNKQLKYLDIQNTTALITTVDLSSCNSLEELYAKGSGATGIIFANGGKIRKAEIPAIGSLVVKNLNYLEEFTISSYDNLKTITYENCSSIDAKNIIESSENISRARIIGVDWGLDNTDLLARIYNMAGIDKNGYNTDRAVLSGKVHVPVVKQQELYNYQKAWPDLDIVYNTMKEQFAVTFVNDDDSVLEIQYVEKGLDAVDPVTRADNPIPVPTKESTISTDFTYAGWDSSLTKVFSDRIIKAVYTESTRTYTIKYVSFGNTLQESSGLYGENVLYNGETPTYTLEEGAYRYYLFNRWDKSGVIDGDKVVNAVFDSFEFTPSAFKDKQLHDLTPVEVYAVTKLGIDIAGIDIQDGDDYSFNIGYDIDFDDIESKEIVSEKKIFDGTNHLDTGIKLFDEDRDFTLAIDYKMANDSPNGSVIAQCYQPILTGFKLWNNNGNVNATWGTTSTSSSRLGNREMIVIRHIKGENSLTVYNSVLSEDKPKATKLDYTKTISTDSTLVFGSAKAGDGEFENNAIGEINWCKIWYMDLGDDACQQLAGWTHEHMEFEVCGFKRYYLSDNISKRCTLSMLAKNIMDTKRSYNQAGNNVGGWAAARLNTFLNNRLYNAMPTQIKSLLKKVIISSSVGGKSTEISTSDCYITIPAAIEVDGASYNTEPYNNEGQPISYMTTNDMRKRAHNDGTYADYWTRSPDAGYDRYVLYVTKDGVVTSFAGTGSSFGILLEISF